MGFLVYPNDYKIASNDEVVKAVVRQDETAIEMAAEAAVEEMKGYLAGRYNVATDFAKAGDARHKLLVMFGADIALYHLFSGRTNHNMPEQKQKRYDRAVQWLKDVARGEVEPTGLTLLSSETSSDTNNPVKWGSTENNSSW